jgi:hypothetical protein
MDKYIEQEYICHETGEYEVLEFPEGAVIPKSYTSVSGFALKVVKFEQIDEENGN